MKLKLHNKKTGKTSVVSVVKKPQPKYKPSGLGKKVA